MNYSEIQLEDALDQAKIDLISRPEVVFLSAILFSLHQHWENIPTAGINGTHLIINPDWFMKMPHPERVGLICHEIGHIMFMHGPRCGDRNKRIWNVAGDVVINMMLLDYGFELPKPGIYGPEYERFRDMSTDQIYDIMIDEQVQPPDWFDDLEDLGELENAEEDSFEIENIVIRAATQQKMMDAGNLPGEAGRLIEELLNPKIPWETAIHEYLTDLAKNDYSYRRVNKKYMPDFFMPTLYSESLDKLVGVVDASGSIYDYEFQEFITEADSLRDMLNPEEIILMSFDTYIRTEKTFTPDESILDTIFKGGGGTKIAPVIDRLKELDPEVAIIFTDGCFSSYYGTPPDFPIVWIIKDNPDFSAEFGKIIHYN